MNVEITAIYLGERFRFENPTGDVIVGDARFVSGIKPDHVDGEIGVKGPDDDDGLCEHLTYRFFGRWTEYRNKKSGKVEQQFAFSSFVEAQPFGKAGIVAYLEKHGKGLGIGRQRAMKLYDAFLENAVEVCRTNPQAAYDVVQSIKGLPWSLEKAEQLATVLHKNQATEYTMIELTELLNKRGFPKTTSKAAIDVWGCSATAHVRRNPYQLMQFRGCGFKLTDKMYLELGHNPNRLKRQALNAWYTIASDSNGHTWHPVETVIKGIQSSIDHEHWRIKEALELSKRSGMLSFARTDGSKQLVETGGRVWVAETKKADQEMHIAKLISQAKGPVYWPSTDILGPTNHQLEHLTKACQGLIGCFGGSPGTGKTYTAACLIKTLIRRFGERCIAVAAPTGKAAVRISEVMRDYQIPISATTIHSLLGVEMGGDGGWSFTHDHSNPLPHRFIIVDESSMIDVPLMRSLLDARSKDTHVLFVGDVNQLPPVGHGAPLRDLIAAGIPNSELTEIKRQDDSIPNMIIRGCAEIRQGKTYEVLDSLDDVDIDAGRNLVRIQTISPEHQLQVLVDVLSWVKERGFDNVWDCQPIVAVNKKSKLSRREVNSVLQSFLNPSSNPNGKSGLLRINDKVVNTKNGTYTTAGHDSKSTYVANGEIGRIVEVHEKFLVIALTCPERLIRVPRVQAKAKVENENDDKDNSEAEAEETSTGCSWDLAYGISAHKSQGSEWPVSIILLDEYPGARMVCSREWLYTSISRGKKLVIEIGKETCARQSIGRVALWDRKTLLRERIAQFELEAAVAEL